MKTIRLFGMALLMLFMSVSFSACSSSDDEETIYNEVLIDGIYYNLDSKTGYAEITCNRANYGNNYYGDINIPNSIEYKNKVYTVTSIGTVAFSSELGIKSITIPSSVKIIKSGAFSSCV